MSRLVPNTQLGWEVVSKHWSTGKTMVRPIIGWKLDDNSRSTPLVPGESIGFNYYIVTNECIVLAPDGTNMFPEEALTPHEALTNAISALHMQ